MELIVIWLGLAVVTAVVANSKGRSGFGWFLLALLISGLLALILVALLPSNRPLVVQAHDPEKYYLASGGGKTCPRCAETVKLAARVCRYCSYEFAAEEISTAPSVMPSNPEVFIRSYKPAFSASVVHETNIYGAKRQFKTETEAQQHIIAAYGAPRPAGLIAGAPPPGRLTHPN